MTTFSQAQKLVNKEGGFCNATSLPATNAINAIELADSLGLNAEFLYEQATKKGIKLQSFRRKLDTKLDDIAHRLDITTNLMSKLTN